MRVEVGRWPRKNRLQKLNDNNVISLADHRAKKVVAPAAELMVA